MYRITAKYKEDKTINRKMHQIPSLFSRLNAIYASKVALCGGCLAGFLYLAIQSPSAMRESPLDAAKYANNPKEKDAAKFVSKDAFEVYRRDGIVVIDNVLTDEELYLARKEINGALDNRNRNRNRNRINNGYSSINNNGSNSNSNNSSNINSNINSNSIIINQGSGSINSGGDPGLNFAINDQNDLKVRSDLIVWVGEGIGAGQRDPLLGPGLLRVVRCLRSVPQELQELGLSGAMGVPLTNQLACYDGGRSHYVPHRDASNASSSPRSPHPPISIPETAFNNQQNRQNQENQQPDNTSFISRSYSEFKNVLSTILHGEMDVRQVTIIIYLNDKTWDSSSGGLVHSGNLRIYVDADIDDDTGSTSSSTRHIAPLVIYIYVCMYVCSIIIYKGKRIRCWWRRSICRGVIILIILRIIIYQHSI